MRSSTGTECFTVARGDYDGNLLQDIAVLLPSENGHGVRLVVGIQTKRSWNFFALPNWCETIERCYVATVEPGTFTRTEALDGPVAGDEREAIKTTTDSVESGTLESTAVVHNYIDGKWVYVWVSD
jgi:hypothetical protein